MDISIRLKTIASYVPMQSRIADIGSDHALLPVYLVNHKQVPYAVAGELNSGPYQAALSQVKQAGLEQHIHVRQGDGLSVINAGEVDTVIIAGMGGKLIVEILEEGKEKLEGVAQLVLQPNVGEEQVRRWLRQNGWFLQNETILEEDGHIYEILFSQKNPDSDLLNEQLYQTTRHPCGSWLNESLLMMMGPYLLRSPSDVLIKKWNSELAKRKRIVKQMKQSSMAEAHIKSKEFEEEIQQLEEMIACLQMAKL